MVIDAKGVYYRLLNQMIREAVANGEKELHLKSVNGQRYIGDGLQGDVQITIDGVPGNDLAAFMDGPTIIVHSNAQDCVANTMNAGKVVINGHAGDVLGYGMRGGKLFIRGDAGYRVGIHMKAFKDKNPVIVIGGVARDFLGEYMAGGILILLGLDMKKGQSLTGNYLGTGMHGGTIYIRGKVEDYQLGKEVGKAEMTDEDKSTLSKYLKEYCKDFGLDFKKIIEKDFLKLIPISSRPYGKLYAY